MRQDYEFPKPADFETVVNSVESSVVGRAMYMAKKLQESCQGNIRPVSFQCNSGIVYHYSK